MRGLLAMTYDEAAAHAGLLAMTGVGVESLRLDACHCEEAETRRGRRGNPVPRVFSGWSCAYAARLSAVPQKARRNSTGTIESSELDREVGKP